MRKFDGAPIVYDPRLFVTSPALIRFRECSVSELLAYRFADLIAMPHLPYTGFWCPDPVYLRRGMSKPNRIGLAIEFNAAPTLSYGWCNRAHRYPNTIAKALVMSVLRCGREVQMALTRNGKYVAFELGGLMPTFSGELTSEEWEHLQEPEVPDFETDPFYRDPERKIHGVLVDAHRYGLLPRVMSIMERVVDTPFDVLLAQFDLSPHPLAAEIAYAAALAVYEQFSLAEQMV
jgi:hypothetical protein